MTQEANRGHEPPGSQRAPATVPAPADPPRTDLPPADPPRTPKPFRWTERRLAMLVSMIVSGAVVVADFALLLVFIRVASDLPGGWGAYWYIPAGIAAVFVYALRRFLRQVSQFRRDE